MHVLTPQIFGPITIYLFFNVSCPLKEDITTTLTRK